MKEGDRVLGHYAISITPDLQLVFDPADNPGDDFVVVPGVRLHLKF